MLSRRNVRIKVMQALYTKQQDSVLDAEGTEQVFMRSVNDSFRLLLFNALYLRRVVAYTRKDFDIKSDKFVPTEEDSRASLRLLENDLSQGLYNNGGFAQLAKKHDLPRWIDKDLVRKLFQTFQATEHYRAYIDKEEPTREDHQNILLALFKSMLKTELYEEHVEDIFPCWPDDKSLIVGAMKKIIKALDTDKEFYRTHFPDDDTVKNFGINLLYHTIRREDEYLEIIKPKLRNWDIDRIAIIDMIIMKMAICEFTLFGSIPTKVTINEYVDVAKNYSTPKSKDFINGILDRLMKRLQRDGLIQKEGRGLVD